MIEPRELNMIYSCTYVAGKALELTRTDVIGKIACQGGAKMVFVVSDGYASDVDSVAMAAQELRDLGVIMLGIGYGDETPLMRSTLESISSNPKDQYTFIFPYDRLIESVPQIAKRACAGKHIIQR